MSAVVPHEGTWIEIIVTETKKLHSRVVPHEGTWIEILYFDQSKTKLASFPTRERGLKFPFDELNQLTDNVVPHEGTWIEIAESGTGLLENCRSPRGNVD